MYDDQRPRFLRRADAVASWAMDGIVALAACFTTLVIFGREHQPRGHLEILLLLGAAALSALPLLVRRRWPIWVLAWALTVDLMVPGTAFSPVALVALYTVATLRPWGITQLAALATAGGFAVDRLLGGHGLPLVVIGGQLVLCALAVAIGLYQSTRLAYFGQLRDRARRLERERELLSDQAASEERLRIARELHDVVAHNVSLMVVQAQALQATSERDSPSVEAARSIAQLGRDAMSEMHRTLQLIRPSGAEAERGPLPTLEGLERLVGQARAAGVPISSHVEGEARALEPALELSAYRIVQEALTNVVKHAAGARTEITVRFAPDALELEIVDHGGEAAPVNGSGHGLIGMRERVALFGGTLDAGPDAAGGFRVKAVLPSR